MTNRFAPGTFTPDPHSATVQKMLTAQFGLELKLLLRNGEQLLLTMFIPITLLVGLTLLPFGSFGDNRAATFVPAIMALAVISTAFTGPTSRRQNSFATVVFFSSASCSRGMTG